MAWAGWAGMPEAGVIVDRAKSFLGVFAQAISDNGCRFDSAAKASAWHISKVERKGGVWQAIWRRVCWAKQLSGRDDCILATIEINQAINSLSRKSGFSPAQWVLGRDIRLPADLMDSGETERLGAIAAASTPTTRFHRKCMLRQAAREAHAQVALDSTMLRAETRQTRPTRGPFCVGDWVFYYDQVEQGRRPEGPLNWRGVARVVGHEGKHSLGFTPRSDDCSFAGALGSRKRSRSAVLVGSGK